MERKETSATDMLLACFGILLIAGILTPFGVAMLFSVCANMQERVIGVLLIVVSGAFLSLFYTIGKKSGSEEQAKEENGRR